MTKTKVKVVSYSVLHNAISLRVFSENPEPILKETKDEPKRVCLDDLFFRAKIRSVSLKRDGGSFLLRTKKSRYLATKFFDLVDKEALDFSIPTPASGKLTYLLSKAATLLGEREEDLLFKLTSFRDKNGFDVEGKRSLDEVSEAQREVVIKKLKEILNKERQKCSDS